MTWIFLLFLPLGIYLSLPFASLWPGGIVALLGTLALITTLFRAVRYDYPAAWWVLLPILITHLGLFAGPWFGGWGAVISAAAELVAIAWTVWAMREDRLSAGLIGFFCFTYAFLPFFFSIVPTGL